MSSVVAPVQVQFRTEGVEAVKRATDDVARSVARSAREAATGGAQTSAIIGRIGASARTAAGGLEAMARTGQASSGVMKTLVTSGAEMAFMFGPKGAIAGAVAITGIAIFQFFKRTRDEITATRKKAQEEVAAMLNVGNYLGLQTQLRDVEIGTPGEFYKDGIRGVDLRLAEIAKERAAGASGWFSTKIGDLAKEERELLAKRAELVARAERLRSIILNPPAAPRPISGLPAVISTARSPYAKPEPEKKLKSLLEIYPAALSASAIAGAVVDKYTGGAVARGADKITRESIAGLAGKTVRSAGESITESIRAAVSSGKSAVSAGLQDYKTEIEKRTKEIADFVQGGVANTLSNAISSAMQAAFSGEGIGGAIKGFLRAMLIGIGQMFQQIGMAYLAGAEFLTRIQAWLIANPSLAIPASIALIALGAALQAGGSSIGGRRGGYGGGGSVYSTAAAGNVIDRGYINPANPLLGANRVTSAQGVTVNNPVFIGRDDRKAQRELIAMIRAAEANNI